MPCPRPSSPRPGLQGGGAHPQCTVWGQPFPDPQRTRRSGLGSYAATARARRAPDVHPAPLGERLLAPARVSVGSSVTRLLFGRCQRRSERAADGSTPAPGVPPRGSRALPDSAGQAQRTSTDGAELAGQAQRREGKSGRPSRGGGSCGPRCPGPHSQAGIEQAGAGQLWVHDLTFGPVFSDTAVGCFWPFLYDKG